MTGLQAWLGYVGMGLLWLTVAGLVYRHRYREWIFFPVFLANIGVYSLLIALWYERFHRPEVYVLKEALLHLVRLVMALELAIRVFRAFPGAMVTLRRVLLLVLAAGILVVVVALPQPWSYTAFVGQVQPRVVNAAIWIFTAIAALILWYRLPVSSFQKAIVLSYVPYLLIFTVFMDRLGSVGWKGNLIIMNQMVYILLLGFWAYVAWRREPGPGGSAPDRFLVRL